MCVTRSTCASGSTARRNSSSVEQAAGCSRATAWIAQLRSAPPLRDGDTVTYWDVQVQLGQQRSIEVRRCRWEPGMPEREVMLYPATFALVGRLVDSLSAALEELD